MNISQDEIILGHLGSLKINATLVGTWVTMLIMVVGARLITRRIDKEAGLSRWQNLLEVLVTGVRDQIRDITRQDADPYLPFIGTLFLFIAIANLLGVVPGYRSPTGSLSTTTALALCVLLAVPGYGILSKGLWAYLLDYLRPTPFMLPFNIIGELSRTIALAVRLYGNIMSGTMIVAILLAITPFLFPVVLQLLGMLTGVIQAYIFAVLAMVYIASATAIHHGSPGPPSPEPYNQPSDKKPTIGE